MAKKVRARRKPAKRAQKPPPLQTTDLDHARRFDQLLDDAIFGVKKKLGAHTRAQAVVMLLKEEI